MPIVSPLALAAVALASVFLFAAWRAKVQRARRPPVTEAEVAPIRALAEALRLPCVALEPERRPARSPLESRIGGSPWLPEGTSWPEGPDGRPMIFLAQLDFAAMPPLADFPDAGLIQFFVAGGDWMQSRVLWWPDPSVPGRAVAAPGIPEDMPFHGAEAYREGRAVGFAPGTMRPSCDDWRIDPQVFGLIDRPNGRLIEALIDELAEERTPYYVGGHPRYTQADIRAPGENEDYDRVLLQLGYDDRDPFLIWGDGGEAVFLIRRADLLARDFSRTLFNWDCS